MTEKQPEALALAAEVDEVARTYPDMAEVSNMLRTQHKQIAAYKLLAESQEAQLSQHRAQADKYREAVATLQSERDANALLTTAIERKDALLRRAAVHLSRLAMAAGAPTPPGVNVKWVSHYAEQAEKELRKELSQ